MMHSGQKLTYTHDGTLPLTETLTGEVSGKVARKYDDDFRVTEQTVNGQSPTTYTYDKDGLLTGAGALEITRDKERALITGTELSGTTDQRTHNPFGELESYEAATGADRQYATTYQRDQLGRITEKTETIAGSETTNTYRYDEAGRLVEVNEDGRTTATYTYDKNGNRLSKETDSEKTQATYDAQDRLLTHGDNEYTYTAGGDLKSKTDQKTGETTTYDYDAFGDLKSAELPDGKKIEYVVDGNDRRVGKKIDGKLEQGFLYSGQLTPVAELDGNGNAVSKFVYGTKANIPDYMIKDGTKYRIVSDHLGSPRLVLNAQTGEIAQRMSYDEFGRVTKDTNPGFQPFGFAGGLYDRDTKLTRFGARDYDAETGRWTAKDPIRFEGGDTNLYGYTFNDPINLLDPNGQDALQDIGDWSAAFGDTVTMGGTQWVREQMGVDGAVNKCSIFYQYGGYGGMMADVPFAAGKVVKGAGYGGDVLGFARSANKMKPNPAAGGPHTVFKRDPATGRVSSYETYKPQTNPRNPNSWESLGRFDRSGKPHFNKRTKTLVPTPHVQGPGIPGGVRPARANEIPR